LIDRNGLFGIIEKVTTCKKVERVNGGGA